jgi:hypothetical protein
LNLRRRRLGTLSKAPLTSSEFLTSQSFDFPDSYAQRTKRMGALSIPIPRVIHIRVHGMVEEWGILLGPPNVEWVLYFSYVSSVASPVRYHELANLYSIFLTHIRGHSFTCNGHYHISIVGPTQI